MIKIHLAKIIGLAWLSLLLPVASPYAQTEALECLRNIQAAVDEGDFARFEELVDVDNILNQCLDVFLEEINKKENMTRLPPLITLMLSRMGASDAARQLLLQEIRAFLRYGMESGAFAGKKLAPAAPQGILGPLFADASLGKKEITFIGKPEAVKDGYSIPFLLHDHGNDNDYGIIGLFQKQDNIWRLTALQNLPELFRQIFEEAAAI